MSESVAWSVVTQVGKYRQTDLTVSGRAQKLCESRGGCPGLPVPNGPYGLCGRKAILNLKVSEPRIDLKKDVELGSHSELEFIFCFRFQLLVFQTLSLGLCSAQLLKEQVAEYTSCFALLRSPTSLPIIVLAVADGLFSL